MVFSRFLPVFTLALVACAPVASSAVGVSGLRCEFLSNPAGIDRAHPRLAWQLESRERGARQSAYQVQVASSPALLEGGRADLWGSGKTAAGEDVAVEYRGKLLKCGQQAWWRVRAWDGKDRPGAWSKPAHWLQGPASASDWAGARWISAASAEGRLPLFRKEFSVSGKVARATVFVCGLGHCELRMNGQKVGNRELEPGWTNYRKTCLYSTYDITPLVRKGANAFGVLLGNGMYHVPGERYTKFTGSFGPPKLILHARIEYAGGKTETISTGEIWRTAPGPMTLSSVYGGEDWDARLEEAGWDRPGFAEGAGWRPVRVTEGPGGALRSRPMEPIVVRKTLKPVSWKQAGDAWVADFGQNASGWPRLRVRGKGGQAVRLIPGEMLKDGRVDQGQSGGPCYWQYTLRGGSSEDWRPRFTYYGYRWVQVEGAAPAGKAAPGQAEIEALESEVLYPDVRGAGVFECSDPLVNRIHDLIRWAMVSNMKSVLTDCPHREKLGWLEQAHLCGPSLMYNYGLGALYSKIAADMREAQTPDGLIPDIAPEYTVFQGGFRDSPEWGSAYIIALWQHYQFTGDRRTLEENYPGMRRYVSYLTRKLKGGILEHGLGDWADVGPNPPGSHHTPMGVTATATLHYDLALMAGIAGLLGRDDEADGFRRQAEDVRAAFNARFFNSDTNQYATGSQTANGIALFTGVVDTGRVEAVAANLVKDVTDRGYHTTAGDVGHTYVLQSLARAGRSDVVLKMMQQTDYPSYGHQLALGATALTEAWDGPARGWSQNHFMLGHAEEWFYKSVLGIDQAADSIAFGKILIRPDTGCGLEWARGSYESARGPIAVDWKREGDAVTLRVTIPPGATAAVRVPAGDAADVLESGKPAAQAPGVTSTGAEPGAALYRIGSGSYAFTSRL